jgi:transcriptional regulator with XRE-family HTH domain
MVAAGDRFPILFHSLRFGMLNHSMPGTPLSNYLRTFRKRSGLSQDDVAFLLGVQSGAEVSRHETFKRIPTLKTALSYEAIFGVPVRELFAGEFQKVEAEIKARAEELARRILEPGLKGKSKRGILARILGW